MTPLQKTIRGRNRLAALFVKATMEMDNPALKCGCCSALSKAQPGVPGASLYETPAHKAFREAFDWANSTDVREWYALDSVGCAQHYYPEDARQARVLALLFCAEMARLGEIG